MVVYLTPQLLHFCVFWLVISLFKMAPSIVLSSVPLYGKAVMCLMEKIHVRQALCRHEIKVLLAVSSILMYQQNNWIMCP